MITIILRSGKTRVLDVDALKRYTHEYLGISEEPIQKLINYFGLLKNKILKKLSNIVFSKGIEKKYITCNIPISNELFFMHPTLKSSQKIAKFENKLAPPTFLKHN